MNGTIDKMGVFKGQKLKTLGPNDLSRLKAQARYAETVAVTMEDYEGAAYYRDKGREIQRHLEDSLESERKR